MNKNNLNATLKARCDDDLRARAEKYWTANKQSESEWVRAACFAYLRHLENYTAGTAAGDPLPNATSIPPVAPTRYKPKHGNQ